MFITPAFAQAPGADGGSAIISLIPFVLIFAIMYFLIIRPQQKRLKAHKEMVEGLRRGDVVVTGGGIVGKVTKVINDTDIEVEIAEGVRAKMIRHMVSEVRTKGEPVKDNT